MSGEIKHLEAAVERLVVFGGLNTSPEWHSWLVSCGIAQSPPEKVPWLVPAMSYLRAVLPARDGLDLLRKSAVRDPLYRLHLDLTLTRVIQVIAKGERWARFEELAFGALRPLSQRMLALVEWAADHCGKPPAALTDSNWSDFEQDLLQDAVPRFRSWDNMLWGQARDAAAQFPLLEELYLPLVGQPVHLTLSGDAARVMAALVAAAKIDDGVALPGKDANFCDELRRAGAPILCRAHTGLYSLTGNVALSVSEAALLPEIAVQPVPLGVPTLARSSRLCVQAKEIAWLQSSTSVGWSSDATFLSVRPLAETWPETTFHDVPEWALLLPVKSSLNPRYRVRPPILRMP